MRVLQAGERHAMTYRENVLPLPESKARPSHAWLPRITILNVLLILMNVVWIYTRIRTQPPERIVRVEVRVPGPERRVEVPAPGCVDSATTLYLLGLQPTHRCPYQATMRVITIPGNDDHVVVECHCQPNPGGVRILP